MSKIPLAGRLALPALAALLAVLPAAPASAQQKLGFVDSAAILQNLPEYLTVRDQMNRAATEWQQELDAMATEIEELEREFEARELLYTPEDRDRALAEIEARRTETSQFRRRYFGPEGELFRQEQQLLRPIQERVLTAIETVADDGGYDFVFDRSGEMVFLYAREAHNITDLVLIELGLDPSRYTGAN